MYKESQIYKPFELAKVMDYKTISLYKYVSLDEPEVLKEKLRNYCEALDILGRIVLGKEVSFKNKAPYITPKKLKMLLDKKTDAILLDARNSYEIKLGKFKNAITLPIETFREFPEAIKKAKLPKNKPIISYCTGGIRCEKAATYLKQQGFKEVYQLKGGIIQYMNEFPNTYFEGNCFVFDDSLTPSLKVKPITTCDICHATSDVMINCHNLECDKLFICCPTCQTKTKKHCSPACEKAPRHRP